MIGTDRVKLYLTAVVCTAFAVSVWGADKKITVLTSAGVAVDEATLFAFDDYSIPFRQNMAITMYPGTKYPGNPVVKRGGPGTPDEYRADFFGTVIQQNGKFKMWYCTADPEAIAAGEGPSLRGWQVAYAESDDGIHWVKPNLGLVEYKGNRNNNLVLMEPEGIFGYIATVLYEPDDPDPSRRYKMMLHAAGIDPKGLRSSPVPLFSADGLRWRLAVKGKLTNGVAPYESQIINEGAETVGLFRWQGMYYMTGHAGLTWAWLNDGQSAGRLMYSFRSNNFTDWSATRSLAFVRWGYRSTKGSEGEEAHEAAAVWNRGNVLVATYGQFHGAPGGSFSGKTPAAHRHPMDLGFLVSNDGIHFREPINDFAFIPQGEPGDFDGGGVIHGQGFVNVGDKTYVYYGGWEKDVSQLKNHAEIGLVTLRRDGFGSISPRNAGHPASFITCPVRIDGQGRLWINADGLSGDASLRVELLDEVENPLPAYSGDNASIVQQSGLRTLVKWKTGEQISDFKAPLKIKVSFEGTGAAAIKVYSLYVTE